MDEMLCQAHHRGPDGYDQWQDEHITLGHNLLSIVDSVENSKQPWIHNDWVLVYNGEIYNYKELGKSLNYKFKTDTDTEVLAVGLEKYGIEFIHKLDGMFAFAAYNKKEKQLIIARDRNGTKPLYYGYTGGKFAFSSEIKSLLTTGFRRKVDKEGFKHFYKQGYNSGYLTMFNGIKKLVPGEIVKMNVVSDTKVSTNINNTPIPLDNTIKNAGDVSDMVRVKLHESVKQTLMGRRKLGLFLSGGIDSTAILNEMTQSLDTRPNTFSSRFELRRRKSRLNQDADIAKVLSEKWGTWHKEITYKDGDYIDKWPAAALALEEPRQGKSLPLYYSVNEMIAKHGIVVTLSGDGGDELMAGYKHHRTPEWENRLQRSCANHRVLQNRELWATHEEQVGYLTTWFPKKAYQGDQLNDFMYTECLNTLAEDFLIRNDKLGMAFGMEGRFPFMSNIFTNFVRSIPGRIKITENFMTKNWAYYNKPLLKTAYYKRLPKFVLERDKTGWRFPTDETIIGTYSEPAPDRTQLKDFIRETMKEKWLQDIFEYGSKEIDNKYMENKTWTEGFNKAGDRVILPNEGTKSQKELFTIMNFAVWFKAFGMSM